MKSLENPKIDIIKTQNHTIPELFENMRQAFLKNISAVVGKFFITYKSAGVRVFELRAGKIFVFCDRELTYTYVLFFHMLSRLFLIRRTNLALSHLVCLNQVSLFQRGPRVS
jgi:hypothetical protein